jgi:hypothetical protein
MSMEIYCINRDDTDMAGRKSAHVLAETFAARANTSRSAGCRGCRKPRERIPGFVRSHCV